MRLNDYVTRCSPARAGLGTRLRPLTDVRAKPAIPVAGEPMIRRIVAWLVVAGRRRPRAEPASSARDADRRGSATAAISARASATRGNSRRSSAAPAVRGSRAPIVGADTFLIVNGDTLTDVDLARLAEAHAASGALVTLALVPNREFMRYGGVPLDADGRVTGFVRRGPAAEGLVSLHRRAGGRRPRCSTPSSPARAASSIGGVYDALIAAQPGAIRGFVSDAAFCDVGTPADYWRTSLAFAAMEGTDGSSAGTGTRIDASAHVHQSILWDDVEVGRRRAARRMHRHRRRRMCRPARRTAARSWCAATTASRSSRP